MELLLPLILAAVMTVALIPLLERRAGALHVMDSPGQRKVHDHPVPRVGGIAMAAGAALAFAFWLPIDRLTVSYLVGALIVLLFGIWDDRVDLKPRTKLLGQLLAVAVVVFAGGVRIDTLTFTSRVGLPDAVALPLTFLFLVGVTNAINLADGLDGLAGGTTLLCFAAIAALAIGSDSTFVIVVALTMIGSLLGFLRFNSYPARVFMGDGGSQFLGFTAGVLAVALTQDPTMPYSAALPLLLLGLPIIDTLAVMVVRVSQGLSPFAADKKHLHHRLMARGLDHFEAVAIIYLLQGVLITMALLFRHQSDVNIALAFVVFAAGLLLLLYAGKKAQWQWQGGAFGMRLGDWVSSRVPWLKSAAHLPRWANVIAWCCLTAYFLGEAMTSTAISTDIAWLALGLALVLMLAASRWLPGGMDRLAHGAAFVAGVMIVYLDHIEPGKVLAYVWIKFLLFPLMAVAVLARLRLWRERRFQLTTLDVLVVFLALVLPNLPGLQQGPSNLGLSVLKLVLSLYAVEMLLSHSERVRRWTWLAAAVALVLIAGRGLIQPVAG